MKNIIKHVGLLVAMLLANNLLAQDTIIQFIYDSGKGNLTVDILNAKGISFGFLQSDTANNATAKELLKYNNKKTVDPLYFFFNTDSFTVAVNHYKQPDIEKIQFFKEGTNNFTGRQFIPDFVYTNTNNKSTDEGSGTDGKDGNITPFLLAGLTVLLLIGVCLIIFSKRKKKTIETPKTPSLPEEKKDLPIKIITPQTATRIVGLDHVREHENEYYLLDIQQQYADTAIHKIYFHHTAVKKTYDFFKTFLESADRTPETGCYLVGCREYDDESHKTFNISVEDIVEPGDDIKPDEYSFSFGYKIGSYLDTKLRNLREKTGRDYVHTVWMHSHPGIGLFLSSQDLVVQKLLKNSKEPGRLAAFVIDTNSPHWDFSVFTTQMDGEMNTQTNKTYSLDELYSWCRKVHAQDDDKNLDDYLKIDLNNDNDGLSQLYVSGKVINGMEEAVYDAGKECKVVGYLSGTVNTSENWCRIEECVKTSNSSIGTMIVDYETPYERLFMKYEEALQKSLVIVVYRSDEEIWLCTRTDTNGQFNTQEGITHYSLNQMRDWMRRKRIYK